MSTATCPNPMCACPSCSCTDCRCGTASIGDLEGRVMDALWTGSESEATVKDVARSFPDLAYTTVATMLDRLTEKGLVGCRLEKHTKYYAANGSRAAYTAMAMYRCLRNTDEPGEALDQFIAVLHRPERDLLRDALRRSARTASASAGGRA